VEAINVALPWLSSFPLWRSDGDDCLAQEKNFGVSWFIEAKVIEFLADVAV
jgi:hypothetical protein